MRKFWLVLMVLSAVAQGRGIWRDDARHDSLPPNVKWYLEQREKHDWFLNGTNPWGFGQLPDSQNVRLVGKWGRGPANKVTGRESLAFMSLGSEVAVFSAPDGHHVRILSEIQCRNMAGRVVLKDSLLFVGSQGPVEVYNVANPVQPRFVAYGPVVAPDIAVQDSLVYALGSDSFYIYNVTDPANWQRLGACRDSGYSLAAADGFAYLCDRWGMYVIDCTDPTNPHRACTLTVNQTGGAWVENGYCYYTEAYSSTAFVIADVTDPYHPSEVGRIANIGGSDVAKIDFFVYLSGYMIVDVGQPSNPGLISNLGYGGNGVWTRSPYSCSFVSNGLDGLGVININDPVHPVLDTTIGGTDVSLDVCHASYFAYVATAKTGMAILSLIDPSDPEQVASYDTTAASAEVDAVKVRDSLAYLVTEQWPPFHFRILDVTNPENIDLLGGCLTWNPGVAVAVRDTLAYVAENAKLEIFSITNPRQPRLVGSCGLVNGGGGLCLQDTFAYVASDLNIVNIADPANPRLVSRTRSNCWSVAVQDTFAFLSHAYESLCVFSVADPVHPYEVGWARLNGQGYDVVVSGNRAYVGCYDFRVFDISDAARPVEIGRYQTPYRVRRVFFDGTYVYAACFDAGVCIFETLPSAGSPEPGTNHDRQGPAQGILFYPNPTRGPGCLLLPPGTAGTLSIAVRDSSGSLVMNARPGAQPLLNGVQVDLSPLRSGVYFISLQKDREEMTTRVVKQ